MKILHTISGIWVHTGGPAESVPRLCVGLAMAGNHITIATLDGPLSSAALEARDAGVDVRTYPHMWQYSKSIARALDELAKEADLVHGHGLWLPTNWATGRTARKNNKPLIITLRGALNPNALLHSSLKKRFAGVLFDNANLKSARCLHATSLEEYQAIRAYGLTNPVAIIPNGVDADVFEHLPDSSQLLLRYNVPAGKKILLYLSRISWEKGLEDLAEAWREIFSDSQDWVLLIVGQGKQNYVDQLKSLFKGNAGGDRVIWAGMLAGNDKLAAYAAASLFVLPSHTENFSLVIAEALAAGLPVVTTQGTPWSELVEKQCGWWVPIGAASLATALREAMSLSDDELKKMGDNGKELIANKYTWDQIASQMIDVYTWVLHGGTPPACVRLD